MGGVSPHGIRHPDGATKAKNLGPELKQMAEDIDAYINDIDTGVIRDLVEGIAEIVVPPIVENYLAGKNLVEGDDPRLVTPVDDPLAWAVQDDEKRTPLYVDTDGVTHVTKRLETPQIGPALAPVQLDASTGYVWALMDGSRRAPLKIRTDGTVEAYGIGGGGSGGEGRQLNRDNGGSDLVLIVGQSNAQGAGVPFDAALDAGVEGLDQFAGSGAVKDTILPAVESLYHYTKWVVAGGGAPRVGPGMEFGRQLWLNQPANRRVLLVPAAQGSTSITGDSNYSWDPDNTTAATNLFDYACDQLSKALATHPRNRVVAILWHQGESDATAGATETWYRDKLIQIIEGFREIAGENTPVLIGSMTPEVIESAENRRVIDRAHKAIPEHVPYTAYVPGPSGMNQDGGIHYNADGARELGYRFFTTLPAAQGNTIPGGN